MPIVNYQLAPGIGELMPGMFAVPQNPMMRAAGMMIRQPRLGELMPGYFTVPQNPLLAELNGNGGITNKAKQNELGSCGCGCNGAGGCGMGSLGMFDPMTLAMLAGGAVLLFMLMSPGGSEYRRKRAALTAKQKEDRLSLRSQYRGYKRAGRAARGRASRALSPVEA